MFGKTWKWAGEFRQTNKNIGVDWLMISVSLKNLCDDLIFQIEKNVFAIDPIYGVKKNLEYFTLYTPEVNEISQKMNIEILTIKEIAQYLKVTEKTIYRLAAGDKILAFKVGGSWRFRKAEIDQWIVAQQNCIK